VSEGIWRHHQIRWNEANFVCELNEGGAWQSQNKCQSDNGKADLCTEKADLCHGAARERAGGGRGALGPLVPARHPG
jgi:hypothetical protein